jgi:hypothetical protein
MIHVTHEAVSWHASISRITRSRCRSPHSLDSVSLVYSPSHTSIRPMPSLHIPSSCRRRSRIHMLASRAFIRSHLKVGRICLLNDVGHQNSDGEHPSTSWKQGGNQPTHLHRRSYAQAICGSYDSMAAKRIQGRSWLVPLLLVFFPQLT